MSVTNISVSPSLATCQAVSTDHCQLSALTTAMVNGHSLLEGVNSGRNLAHFLESRKLQEDPLSPSPPAPPTPPANDPSWHVMCGGEEPYNTVGEAHNTMWGRLTTPSIASQHLQLSQVSTEPWLQCCPSNSFSLFALG